MLNNRREPQLLESFQREGHENNRQQKKEGHKKEGLT